MNRIFLLVCLGFCYCSGLLNAQVQKERRVYYLDCSYSMVTNKIWDPVCDKLISAIYHVEDNTTELWVIPFAVDGIHHETLNPIKAVADTKGKQTLENAIKSINPSQSSMTYHSDPIKDFYNNNRVATGNCITYLFFMTDGQNEEKEPYNFERELEKWKQYSNAQVYGFYVMLHQSAYNTKIEQKIDELPHFWNVHSADVNISLARVPKTGVFNVRNESCLELPITGDANGYNISAKFEDKAAPYIITKTEIVGNVLKVSIEPKPSEQLPEAVKLNMNLVCTNAKTLENNFKFWLTDNVAVTCFDKKERTLKISIK